MKSKLFVSLSSIALIGLSVTAYGRLYIDGHASDNSNTIPQGDCLEMMCEYGCVEEEGTFLGHCCPGDGSCRVDGKNIPECCDEGKTCNSEGKCENSEYKEECAVYLFKKSANQMKNSKDGENPIICCDGEITTAANTDADTRGYEKDENAQKGCCPKERTNKTNSDPKKWTCCNKTQKAVSTGCCVTDKVYVDIDGEEKCCPVANQLPKYNQSCNTTCGCFSPNTTGLSCSTQTNLCVCPEGLKWNKNMLACTICEDCKICPISSDYEKIRFSETPYKCIIPETGNYTLGVKDQRVKRGNSSRTLMFVSADRGLPDQEIPWDDYHDYYGKNIALDFNFDFALDSHLGSKVGDYVWRKERTQRLEKGTEIGIYLFNDTGTHSYRISQ